MPGDPVGIVVDVYAAASSTQAQARQLACGILNAVEQAKVETALRGLAGGPR